MRRRSLFHLGLAGTLLLGAAGLGTHWLTAPVRQAGKLSPAGRDVMAALARAVLQGALPPDAPAQAQVLDAHLSRVEDTMAGLPAAVQSELDLLLALLASAPGRIALAGLDSPWAQAPTTQVQAMLQTLRQSSLAVRQQTYQALRDITCAAFYAGPSAWPSLGYGGPRDL